jgi:protocatechuate 3,4-dioxygenase beta subunit
VIPPLALPALAVLVLAGVVHESQAVDAPPTQPPPATATIKGRVVDKSTGAPLRAAVVTVTRMRGNEAVQTLTNDKGEFELTPLVPDLYDVSATAGEFSASHVRHGPGAEKPVQLAAGGVHEVTIALIRALAISGRVVDDAGQPLSDARMELVTPAGPRFGSTTFRSDDLGAFRIFSLAPGRYLVCAQSSSFPRFAPPPPARPARFVRSCYPGADGEAGAQPVILADSDVEGIEIRMQRRPTFTIAGVVVDANGAPAPAGRLELERFIGNGTRGFVGRSAGPSGEFIISDLVPGTYAVVAHGAASAGGNEPLDSPYGAVQVEITSADVDGLVVPMKSPVILRGSVRFEDPPPPDVRLDRLHVNARRVDRGWPSLMSPSVPVSQELTFELRHLVGPYVLEVSGLPRGMAVKDVRYRNADIHGVQTEFDGDARQPVAIVLTSRLAELSGRVLDDRGNPVAGARVIGFPADRSRWTIMPGLSNVSGKTGSFRLTGLVAGEYFVAAVSKEDERLVTRGLRDPAMLERLAAIAERLTVLENDRRAVDVTLRPLGEDEKK